MKKVLIVSFLWFLCLNVNAMSYIDVESGKFSSDGKKYSDIVSYDSLDEFKDVYESDELPDVYFTSFLFDGVSSVKSPDLDDFIDSNSNSVKVKTLSIKVLNIKSEGEYELTGKASGMMIAVNTNGVKGDIDIVLNNVNIDTDSKKAPVIYVYNRDINYTDCKVTISPMKGTSNYLEGGKFKKVSLMPSDDLDSYSSYYSGDALSNFKKYSSYYGFYTKDQLDNILFATVQADNEDLQDGDPVYFYKGSGAISSDIDLYFEGEGFLSVTSKNKEGIETKGNMTFSGGVGDYVIVAEDDCLNTTTKSGNNVRNDLIIDVNSLTAIVSDDGDEGDAIDSNGSLIINGGKIYAFAHSNSGDAGLDSDGGTYINGGTIIATGNMADRISSDSKQNYIYVNFGSKIEKDSLIIIRDQDNKIITAFRTSKDISTLFYSSDDLDYKSFKVYVGGDIDGDEVNGLYSNINSYEVGDEVSYSLVSSVRSRNGGFGFIGNLLIGEVVCLLIVIIYVLIDNKRSKA